MPTDYLHDNWAGDAAESSRRNTESGPWVKSYYFQAQARTFKLWLRFN